jgi:hypothetical protein
VGVLVMLIRFIGFNLSISDRLHNCLGFFDKSNALMTFERWGMLTFKSWLFERLSNYQAKMRMF